MLNVDVQAWPIDRRLFLRLFAAGGLSTALPASADAQHKGQNAAALLRAFAKPPRMAGPGAYWYWLGGNVTREGITADLEAMHEAGIVRPMLFTIGAAGKDTLVSPPAAQLSPHWWDLVEHAVKEAARLDMVLAMNCCDGWGTAGAAWITPELSMQHVVWSSTIVTAGQRCAAQQPVSLENYYRDIAVLAHPFPEEWSLTSATQKAKVTTDLPLKVSDPAKITDPDNQDEIVDTQDAGTITYEFAAPFTLRSVTVHTPSPPGYAPGVYRAANSLLVEVSDDGMSFREIGRLEYPKHGWQTDLTTLTHALPQTTARFFRLVHKPIPPQPYEEEYDFGQDTRLRFFSIVLSGEPRIHHWQGKTGEQWAISRRTTAMDIPDNACIKPDDIVDLTAQLSADGTLNWPPPNGRWRILRIGYTTTGKKTSAAGGAGGLECDRFNSEAAKLIFDRWFKVALDRAGPKLAGKVLHVLHVDSWEAGTQNWSPAFAAGFKAKRGYDLLPYLLLMTGTPLESADVSERVLFDVRRTINDMMQEHFFATVANLAHDRGCVFSAEPANPTFPADGMEHAAHVDMPMGEFWLHTPRNDKPTDIKDAVNGARLYGRQVAGAESFTEGLMDWTEQPFTFKALGDHNYCEGINKLMLHVYAQQPWLDRAPGMTLNGIGTFFSRTQTWWKSGKAWFDYLRRCQALLQTGTAKADICYFIGENIPCRSLLPRQLTPALPEGYAYDSINRDALLRLARTQNGRIELASGASYRVLVLPDGELLTPEIAEQLLVFAQGGAVIVGPRPKQSPSFIGGPGTDRKLRSVADELWGDLDGTARTERRVGQGRVVWGKPLETVFYEIGIAPDIVFTRSGAPIEPGKVEWTHRTGPGWDLYFLSNQSVAPLRLDASFRVSGRVPELLYADSGTIETQGFWQTRDGRTHLPLALDPAGSVFVLFARSSRGEKSVVAVEGDNAAAVAIRLKNNMLEAEIDAPGAWTVRTNSGHSVRLERDTALPAFAIDGPWQMRFAERLKRPVSLTLNALASWSENEDPDVRYYSGTAEYRTHFTLPVLSRDLRLILDLGEVHDLANVRLNGRDLGTLWKPPFEVDITKVARPGVNRLHLAVTNTWRNRLIGDFGKPQDERIGFVVPMLRKGQPWLPGGEGTVLSAAGLLGPVRIKSVAVLKIG